ncbi:MAG: hypothetical protein M5U26_30530 [Planctomycetota bacterium]|nr:hypothetical protein [Planctomycetota bacterium]
MDAPIAGREPANAQTARGEVLREGLRVARGEAELRTEAGRPKLLMLRRVKLEALRARSYLPSPGEAETLARIWNTLRVGLAGKPGERAEPAGGWSVYLYDLKAEGGLVEFAGPDPHGRTAYWRLDDLMLETQQFGVGPLARSPKDRPGFLRLESPTASSEGNGRVRMEWKRLSGSHPEWTYLLELELRGLALPALSTRLGNKADAGFVRGDLDAKFSGPTVAGRLDWSGSLTVSQDTQLADPGRSERRSRSLQRLATGEPIQPILITGTLQDPRIEVPDYAKHALQEVFDGIVDNKVTRFVGDVVGSTVRGVGKVLERVPVLGPLFGGDDE